MSRPAIPSELAQHVDGRQNPIGVIGLGVMGASLARNLASRGFQVAAFNRSPDVGRRLQEAHPQYRQRWAWHPSA